MPDIAIFDFFLGGFGSTNFRLKLDGSVLRCSVYEDMPLDMDKVIPIEGNTAWETLTRFIKSCKWKKRYDDPVTCDGTQWELQVSGNGIGINSYGSNVYPEHFDEFLALLNRVVGAVGIKVSY